MLTSELGDVVVTRLLRLEPSYDDTIILLPRPSLDDVAIIPFKLDLGNDLLMLPLELLELLNARKLLDVLGLPKLLGLLEVLGLLKVLGLTKVLGLPEVAGLLDRVLPL